MVNCFKCQVKGACNACSPKVVSKGQGTIICEPELNYGMDNIGIKTKTNIKCR